LERSRKGGASHRALCAEKDVTGKLDPKTLELARAAGLDKAIAHFPDCVADAARAAAQDLADVPPIDGSTEPWPAMRVRNAR
jgi:hypothetical protein